MGIIVNQNDNRSKLQERLAAELTEKSRRQGAGGDGATSRPENPDGVEDSAYMEGTKKTTSLAWAWVLIVIATIVVLVWLVIMATNR